MSFWESELGEITGNSEDAFTKTFTQIPDGTHALAKIASFKNGSQNDHRFLSIDWLLVDGEFKGRKVVQKIKVYGDGSVNDKNKSLKSRHRALNMLKLIFLVSGLKPAHGGEPTDDDLAVFIGKSAGIVIRETEPNQFGKTYNWVSEVHPSAGFKCETGIKIVSTKTNQELYDTAFSRNSGAAFVDDELPF